MIDIVTQLRSYQHATNVRGEVRQMAGRAADDIDRMRATLQQIARDCFKVANDEICSEAERRSWLAVGKIAQSAYTGTGRE